MESKTIKANAGRMMVTCRTCGKPFSISAEEQAWLQERGLKPFTHCKACRKARKSLVHHHEEK